MRLGEPSGLSVWTGLNKYGASLLLLSPWPLGGKGGNSPDFFKCARQSAHNKGRSLVPPGARSVVPAIWREVINTGNHLNLNIDQPHTYFEDNGDTDQGFLYPVNLNHLHLHFLHHCQNSHHLNKQRRKTREIEILSSEQEIALPAPLTGLPEKTISESRVLGSKL